MHKIAQAVILAGGQGKRLQPFTLKNPKPIIPINGQPFINYLISLLKDNGIKKVVILTGYHADKIEKQLGNGSKFGIKIDCSYTPLLNENGEENESGLRLKNAAKLLDDFFLLLYCDNYWPLQLKKLTKYFNYHPSDVLVTVYANVDNSTKNNIFVNAKGYVSKYDKSRQSKYLNGIDIGFFIVNKSVVKLLPGSNSSFEMDVLPKLILNRKLSGYLTNQKYYSVGDMPRVKLTEKFLSPKKIIFLDRDGVINKKAPKSDYIKHWNEFEFLPGAIEAIKLLSDNGFQIFIVSNQAGITRGLMDKKDLDLIHENMLKEINNSGAKINGIYVCTHGWDDGCGCRKPKPGLLLQASNEHYIDLTKSILIGDDIRDKQTGQEAGCKTLLVTPRRNLFQIVKTIV